jgi:hypothetical protein
MAARQGNSVNLSAVNSHSSFIQNIKNPEWQKKALRKRNRKRGTGFLKPSGQTLSCYGTRILEPEI